MTASKYRSSEKILLQLFIYYYFSLFSKLGLYQNKQEII